MIFTVLIKLVITIVSTFLSILMTPISLIFPNVVSFDDSITNIMTFVSNTVSSTFNLFAYFSHPSAYRMLVLSMTLSLFVFPVINYTYLLIKIGFNLFHKIVGNN